jgi:hypothetical protein
LSHNFFEEQIRKRYLKFVEARLKSQEKKLLGQMADTSNLVDLDLGWLMYRSIILKYDSPCAKKSQFLDSRALLRKAFGIAPYFQRLQINLIFNSKCWKMVFFLLE